MLEMKVTITAATDLIAALNNLAAVLDGKNPHTVCNQFGADSKHIDNVGTINMEFDGKKQPTTPSAPAITNIPVRKQAVPNIPVQQPTPNIPAQQPVPTAPVPQPQIQSVTVQRPVTIPTAAPQYTRDMLANAGAALADAGKRDQLKAVLRKYGTETLALLPPEQYGALANDLRALGAVI